MLQVENLVKRYGERTAVDGVSFEVERGQTIGLLGRAAPRSGADPAR